MKKYLLYLLYGLIAGGIYVLLAYCVNHFFFEQKSITFYVITGLLFTALFTGFEIFMDKGEKL